MRFSRLSSAYQWGIWKSIKAQQGGLQKPVEVLIGKGKWLFGACGLSLPRPFSTSGTVHLFPHQSSNFAVRSDAHIVIQQRNLSVVGTVSPSFSDSTQISLGGLCQRSSKPACCPRISLGDDCIDKLTSRNEHLPKSTNQASLSYSKNGLKNCSRTSLSLINGEVLNSYPIYGNFTLNAKSSSIFNPLPLPVLKGFHKSSSACYTVGAAPDVSFDGTPRAEQLAGSTVSSSQKSLGDRTLKLLSGSCYIPHPDKEKTGGEDAHFICEDERAIGVADGVGGWIEMGIDAGKYARELMSNSVTAIHEEPEGSIDPARVLEKAHLRTKVEGSSTACIIVLREQGIHAINLGDSGFIVVRDGCTLFRSPVQQHDFNFSYQLESGNRADLPSSGQIFTIPVAPGDVIVAGTDGLFDNLYNNEITAVIVHTVRAGLGPQVTAQKIAALARQRALDKNRQTPFSTAAQDAGIRYYGGKLDDITVIVSYITNSTNL